MLNVLYVIDVKLQLTINILNMKMHLFVLIVGKKSMKLFVLIANKKLMENILLMMTKFITLNVLIVQSNIFSFLKKKPNHSYKELNFKLQLYKGTSG